jgi:hypothetical protein
MQSSEHWRGYHCPALATRRCQNRCARGSLAYRPMRPPLVEVRDVLGQDLTQVTLIEDEGVIQALLSDRSHPALGNGIGLRRSKRGTNLNDSEAFQASIEERTVMAVPIADQEARRGRSQPQHSTICCATHSAVGCRVTWTWSTSRLA